MHKARTENHTDAWTLKMIGLYSLAFGLDIVLFFFVMLREDPLFWRNEGGYPIWLRGFVLHTFYPLLFAQFVALGASTLCQFRAGLVERATRLAGLAAMTALWLLFGIILVILVWNNADNLLNGRDLHYHPPLP